MSYIAGILLLVSGLPQTYKLIKTKTSNDISLWTYYMTAIAILFILTEAEGGILMANTISIIILTINIILIHRYR